MSHPLAEVSVVSTWHQFLFLGTPDGTTRGAGLSQRKRLPNHVSEELLDALAETELTAHSDATAAYLDALRACREKLSATDEELLGLRYVENLGTHQIADRLRRPQPSVCNSLRASAVGCSNAS